MKKVNSNRQYDIKTSAKRLKVRIFKAILAKLSMVGYSLGSLTIKGYEYTRTTGVVCNNNINSHYFIHQIKPGHRISYHINPNDPNKIEVLPDENNLKKYQLVSRGTECYTHPNHDRYNTYGLFIELVPDPDPKNPATSFSCKVDRLILPTDLVPCDSGTTYTKIKDGFSFNYNSLRMEYESIRRSSRMLYNSNVFMDDWVISIGVDPNKNPSTYFNDQFMEMLMAQPFRQLGRIKLADFTKDNL